MLCCLLCGWQMGWAQTMTVTDTIFDREAHEDDFAFGADVSFVPQMEGWGTKWLDKNGKQKDILQILKEQGVNNIRLRVWTVNSGASSKQEVVSMCKRAKAKGMGVMIDFHYSDTWADPGSQTIPSAWTDHSVEALSKNVYDHTYDVLKAIKDAGVVPKWVQVGNETKRGMLYPVGQTNKGGSEAFAKFVQSGYNAVKAVDSTMQVIVHLPDGHDNSLYRNIFDGLKKNGAKWDIIGLSAYPRWSHLDGPTMITKVMANINDLKKRYGTPCMIVETGHYPSQAIEGNQYLVGVMDKMIKNGDLGCFYWEPESMGGYDMGAWDETTRMPTVMMDAFLGVKHTAVSWIMKTKIVTPEAEQTVSATDSILLEAAVTHIRKRPAEVTFFVDGQRKGVARNEPYQLKVKGLKMGAHQVWNQAKDAAGNVVVSDSVTFYVGESVGMDEPELTDANSKGGTAEWNIHFKATGKYLLQFCYASDGTKVVEVRLNGDSISNIYFLKKENAYQGVECEVKQVGNTLLNLKAKFNTGLPEFRILRVYPLEGQSLPEAGNESLGIEMQHVSVQGDAPVEIYSLSGVLVRRTTAREAGMGSRWDGRPQLNWVGGTPYIVRKLRLK